jgi:hypothetical protein
MISSKVIEAIAVTAELCGRVFSPAAAAVFANDLDGFSEQSVLGALTRCRKEVRGMLTLQDVVSRIDDGRPGVEQAWAMLPHGEDTSVVWSEEMAEAWGQAAPLLADGDRIGARMAFKETYAKKVADARDQRIAPKWTCSFGRDVQGRQAALIEAVRHNRLSLEHATQLLPADAGEGLVLSLGFTTHPLLAAPSVDGKKKVAELLLTLNAKSV